MAATTASQPIILHFQNVLRVAGETITGTVDLNVALAQQERIEEVRIKFRGAITTRITTQNGQTRITHRETIPLIHSNRVLWTPGSAFPTPDSHIVSLAFQFQLPANLPPSFHCDAHARGGAISYSLEVVGDRPGIFRTNRRIRRVFSVVPAASQNQLLVNDSLRQGWLGPWKDIKRNEQLRQGIWGEYSRAAVTLSLPDLPSFPIATPIPYSLHIVTETKTIDRTERPEDKHGKPLFPIPPAHSGQLLLNLHRTTQVRVRTRTRHIEDTFDLQTVRRLSEPPKRRNVEAVVDEPVWVPKDTKDRGFWRRSVHFNSTLDFPYAPSTSAETLDWIYALHFTIPFPGLGNNLKIQFPIHLGASTACPPPPIGAAGTSSLTYADVPPAGPPPMLDLPPAYWSGENHDWDEKS
ncbi:Arrestin-N domain-containing protein [Mycena sanguinolenta]|uniref:Arrestin-N domain-containing protein n=1 Tax=Mycena sanguinolenta TaxID=230812 RepID=A0A8H6XPZ0_9AGAR|nr:Arrestin-N domain-containing protein [Mycena sanguinolenta]